MKVLFSPEVQKYLKDVSITLYEKGYFGFLDSAEKYVDELFNDITKKLPTSVKRPAPEYFSKYGKKLLYSWFLKNKTTKWYVFFNLYEDNGGFIYLVRYISNNHVIAQYLQIYS